MRRSRIPALAAVVALVATGGSLIAGEGVAGASCMLPVAIGEAIRQADVVVVGTVATTHSLGRIATVRVEDVWKGHVDLQLEVFGGPASERTATDVDRTYKSGTRYLLFVHEPSAHGYTPTCGGRYEDNSCSDTRPYTQALAARRPLGAFRLEHPRTPASPRVAAPTSHSSGSHAAWWELLAAMAAAAAIATFVIRRTKISTRIG